MAPTQIRWLKLGTSGSLTTDRSPHDEYIYREREIAYIYRLQIRWSDVWHGWTRSPAVRFKEWDKVGSFFCQVITALLHLTTTYIYIGLVGAIPNLLVVQPFRLPGLHILDINPIKPNQSNQNQTVNLKQNQTYVKPECNVANQVKSQLNEIKAKQVANQIRAS